VKILWKKTMKTFDKTRGRENSDKIAVLLKVKVNSEKVGLHLIKNIFSS